MKWIKSTLCCDCYTKINLFFYSAQLWAQKIGKPCSFEEAINLHDKFVCKNHFLERDFTTPEKKASQDPTPQLPDSTFTDLNSLPSLLSPQKNLHVQASSRSLKK